MEARARRVLAEIDEVATFGGGRERVRRLKEVAIGLEKAIKVTSKGADRLSEEVNGLLQTVLGIRKKG